LFCGAQKALRAQIKDARAFLGWSQDQLADIAGVSQPTSKREEK
jgi:DNA-binding XRE family transcriptional regulator